MALPSGNVATIDMARPAKPTIFSMIVTPMEGQGRLDEPGIRAHLRRMAAAGVGVFLGSGGSGEGHALTLEERSRVYRIGVEECRGRVPVYCNPPEARSAREMLQTVRLAVEAGVDVVSLYQLDAGHGRMPVISEQERYFRDVLEQTDHPVGLFIHSAAGYLAPVELTARLCHDYPQVVAINMPAGPTLMYLVRLKDSIRRDVRIYVGMANLLDGLLVGAWGATATEPNQAPHLCRSIIEHYLAGDLQRAAEAYRHVLRITDIINLGRRTSSDGPKAGMEALGIHVGPPRPPRTPVAASVVEDMRRAFVDMRLPALESQARAALRSGPLSPRPALSLSNGSPQVGES